MRCGYRLARKPEPPRRRAGLVVELSRPRPIWITLGSGPPTAPNHPGCLAGRIEVSAPARSRCRFAGEGSNCDDWESTAPSSGRPRVGFSWPTGNRQHWMSGANEIGCGAAVNIIEMGGPDLNDPIVGSGGGYGAIYCFALRP